MVGLQNSGLTIFQWNCNGLLAHINEFKHHLSVNSYDVICLQETFLKPTKNFSLTGYSVVRKDRLGIAKGGLVTLIKDSLNYTDITPQDGIECITVRIKTNNSYITVVNLYIPPDHTVNSDLLSSIFTPRTVIVGDLNAKNRLWGSPDADQRGMVIENLMDDNNFVVLNNGQPTYTHYNGTQTHLDLALICHTLGTKSDWEVVSDTLGSDHSPTVTHINVHPTQETDNSQKFLLSKADWESFKTNSRRLLTVDLVCESKSVTENAELLTSALTEAAELSIPQVKTRKIVG